MIMILPGGIHFFESDRLYHRRPDDVPDPRDDALWFLLWPYDGSAPLLCEFVGWCDCGDPESEGARGRNPWGGTMHLLDGADPMQVVQCCRANRVDGVTPAASYVLAEAWHRQADEIGAYLDTVLPF